MKNLILISALLFSSLAFGQSKKTINRELKLQLEEVKKLNDSLNKGISDNLEYQSTLRNSITYFENLADQKLNEIREVEQKINTIRGDLMHSGYDPEQLVKEKDLVAIHSLMSQTIIREVANTPSNSFKVEDVADFSNEKIKVQNQLLTAKISEYNLANENNSKVLREHIIASKLTEQEKKDAENDFERYVRINLMLEEKYKKLKAGQIEFERQAAAAEENRLKALEESKKKPTKKSTSKVKFEPPVFIEKDDHQMTGDGFIEDNYEVPPPPPKPQGYYPKAPEIYEVVEEQAEFPGGFSALKVYLQENLIYPKNAIVQGIQGKVFVKFIVSATGELSDIQVKRGISDCPECSEEAIRLVSNMPKWAPAKNRGVAVKSYFNLPIVFKLEQ